MIFILQILLVLILLYILFGMLKHLANLLVALFFWGAIYVPINDRKLKKIIELANIKPNDKVVDLGSGDGRLVVAFSKLGVKSYGYEINPFLVRRSIKSIKKAGLEEKAFVSQDNFWKKDLSEFDVVVIYGMGHMMGTLEKKLKKELKSGARVISNSFQFPDWTPVKKEDNVFLYEKM